MFWRSKCAGRFELLLAWRCAWLLCLGWVSHCTPVTDSFDSSKTAFDAAAVSDRAVERAGTHTGIVWRKFCCAGGTVLGVLDVAAVRCR